MASTQLSGANPGPIIDLNYDRAIMNIYMANDVVAWITRYKIEPCDCEKDKILKKKLEELRKTVDTVLELL